MAAQCIYIKKIEGPKSYQHLVVDNSYHFTIYGENILIYPECGACLATLSFEQFKKHFSYLQDSKGRMML